MGEGAGTGRGLPLFPLSCCILLQEVFVGLSLDDCSIVMGLLDDVLDIALGLLDLLLGRLLDILLLGLLLGILLLGLLPDDVLLGFCWLLAI